MENIDQTSKIGNNEFMAQNLSDHDLLIRLDEKVGILIGSVDDLKTGTAMKLADHEKRIADLESKNHDFRQTWKMTVAVIAGVSTVIGVILGAFDHILDLLAHK